MPSADEITELQRRLFFQRRTLGFLLEQLARQTLTYALPALRHDIADTRAAIADIKTALRVAGVAVDDVLGDAATPAEQATWAVTPAPTTYIGDTVGGDKIDGDEVNWDKIVINHYAPQPDDPQRTLQAAWTLLATLPLDVIPAPATLPQPHRMPLRSNPQFVGRDDDLRTLALTLKYGATTVIAAATGMGGIGKTQLATEFVHRYGQYFAGGVFWLSCADPSGVPAEIAACGARMGFPRYEALQLDDQLQRVAGAWEHDVPRLLVFDNCEDAQVLRNYSPVTGGCRVLVTSRRRGWEDENSGSLSSAWIRYRALRVSRYSESFGLISQYMTQNLLRWRRNSVICHWRSMWRAAISNGTCRPSLQPNIVRSCTANRSKPLRCASRGPCQPGTNAMWREPLA